MSNESNFVLVREIDARATIFTNLDDLAGASFVCHLTISPVLVNLYAKMDGSIYERRRNGEKNLL